MPKITVDDVDIECVLVLFDLDGTLVEKEFRNGALAKARFREIKKIVSQQAATRWAKLSGVDTVTFSVDDQGPLSKAPRKEDITVATTAIWLDKINWFKAKELAIEAYELADKEQSLKYKPKLIEGIEKTLVALKEAGFMLGIATNGSGKTTKEIMGSIGADCFFDVYIGADEVSEGKPEPDMILKACERLRIDPSNSVFVGDELVDAIAGTKAGVAEIIIVGHEPDVSKYTKLVIDSVAKIMPKKTSTSNS
jgi:phosphoglycolate phosphatase